MAKLKPRARLFVNATLADGARVDLTPGQAHYLRNVLRCAEGDGVALFNGVDGEWLARLSTLSRSAAGAALVERRRGQVPVRDFWLCFAPLKKAATDFVVTKATELGVSALQPVLSRHSETARVNLDRLRASAVEAAEQCERLDVPEIRPAVALPALLAGWPAERALIVCAESGGATPIMDAVSRLVGRPAAILVGPEGGFAKSELDGLRDLPFVHAVGLGPRILRADTAALAALSCWQAVAGDCRGRPPDRSG